MFHPNRNVATLSLSIIIVNYKSSLLIAQCLRSVKEFNATISYEIIVVDNFSQDDSHKTISSAHPDVVWVQMNYNAGFARANNAGIRQATGETILLLNPDTIAVDDSIEQCYDKVVLEILVEFL